MATILALPSPSSLPSSSTYGRAKALLASDAPPVTPIRSVPDEERRQQLRRAAGENNADPAGYGADQVGGDRVAGGRVGRNDRSTSESAQSRETAATSGGDDGRARPNVDLQTLNAGPVAGYVAQSLYQETMGSGLHIEPWRQALGAYQRANAAGYASSSVAFSV